MLIGNQLLGSGVTLAADAAEAAEKNVASLSEIVVEADKIVTPSMQASETVYTGSEVTAKGMEIQGVKANTSVYEAVGVLPGINVESADGRGLGAEQRSVRIRGVQTSRGALTVEGIPNYGGNPIGPRDYLYDMENMSGVSVYKGAVPGDIGTGIGSRGGAMELKPDWPHEQFTGHFSQSFGSDAYSRSFFRVDSGNLTDAGTKFSASYSYTDADKWRGPGSLGPRQNANFALDQPLGERLDVKVWVNHNDLDQHLYRALSYQEMQNLGANYTNDYNENRTGVAAKDINYYEYNRGSYQNDDLMSILSWKASNALGFKLKPYYSHEDTEILGGTTSGGGMVQKRTRDIERSGFMVESLADFSGLKTVLGYHFESSNMEISTQNYAITGTGLSYRGLGVFGTSGTGYLNSPYLKLAGKQGAFDWQVGLKYFNFIDPESDGYVAGSAPSYAAVRAADLDREETTYDIWLPTLGASYRLSDALQAYGSYGKSFIRPYSYLPLVTLYSGNRAAFQAKGLNLQDMFNGYDLEESDNFDLGLRIGGSGFDVTPTIFYGKHKNLLTTIYDPRVNLNYQQNIGKATSHGLDLEMNGYLRKDLTVFVNPSYTVMTYDEDLRYAGARLPTEGNQVVDTPEWLVKTGVIYHPGDFEIVPMLRYLSKRYSDATNTQQVSDSVLVDLRASYTLRNPPIAKSMKFTLELNNIFDQEYISIINASDDTRAGVATYYPGAPFSAMLIASLQF
ncbi:MAG: TonB-dependent receptor [Desulfobulbaceae bacterium A2]|nr:MAG: TonB-dependent receptor [Desulfobulbaceae bacterium A2]